MRRITGKRLLTSTIACVAIPALAQGTASPAEGAEQARGAVNAREGSNRNGQSASRNIDEVIVTAQRREERLQDVPISVSVLGGKQLDGSPDRTLAESLTRVPGVVTSSVGASGGSLVTVRGVAAPGANFFGSTPVAYYLDAVPFALVRTAFVPDLNAYDLARVEVLRGPQGILYGANAQSGVVRVLTNAADVSNFEFKLRSEVSSTQWASDQNYRGDAAINLPLVEDRLGVRGVLGYQRNAGWIDAPGREDVNDSDLLNARVRLNARPTDNFSLGLSAWSSRTHFDAPSQANDARQQISLIEEAWDNDFDLFGVNVGYDFDGFTLDSSTGYLDFSTHSALDLVQFGLADRVLFTNMDAEVLSQEVNLRSDAAGPWRWSFGGIYRDAEDILRQDRTTYAGVRAVPFAYVTPAETHFASESYAVYGQLSRLFANDKLEFTLGLRYFNDRLTLREVSRLNGTVPTPNPPISRDSTFDATSPAARLTWRPNDDMMLYASYSEGFRSGTHQLPAALFVAPSLPDASPDNLINYEVGAKGDLFGDALSFEAAVYYIDWEDVQQPISIIISAGIGQAALINGTSASGVGLDAGVTLRPAQALSFDATVSVNDLTQDEDVFSNNVRLFSAGERLNFSPKYTAGLGMNYELPIGDLAGRFSTSANYVSSRVNKALAGTAVNTGLSDSLLTAQASFSLTSPSGWTASLFADNLTNEDGRVANILYPGNVANPRLRPRTIGLQLEYDFK